MSGGHDRLKKLRWQSRRGMKELDVLLEAFLNAQGERLIAGDWPGLERLLDAEDDVLFDWIAGRNLPPDPALAELIEHITHAR